MKTAIIYGGAFNPPTLAHHAILQACFDYAKSIQAEVWLLPSGERTDKTIGLPIDHRIALVSSLINDVDLHEIPHKIIEDEVGSTLKVSTYLSYMNLQKQFPDYKQIWVFGSDSILTMKQWSSGEWLHDNLSMLIIKRHGFKLSVLPLNAKLVEVKSNNVSSTDVRRLHANKKSIQHLVPPTTHSILMRFTVK